jgi:hypothetical protein
MKAINHMKTLLAENGSMLVTMPIGYNPAIDKMVFEENTPFEQQYFTLNAYPRTIAGSKYHLQLRTNVKLISLMGVPTLSSLASFIIIPGQSSCCGVGSAAILGVTDAATLKVSCVHSILKI